MKEKRVPVQAVSKKDGIHSINKPPGTISWEEHVLAWTSYAAKYGDDWSAEDIARRGGFCYVELQTFLGKDPETWQARDNSG